MGERYIYLRNKFKDLFKSNESTLFILKCQECNEYDKIVNYLRKLLDTISNMYVSGKFYLLAVTDDRKLYEMLKMDSSSNRGCALIARFADDADTARGGDIDGWIEIINYYDHIKDMGQNAMNYVSSTVGQKNGSDIFYKYMVLKEWCEELQNGKDWLENQWKNKCKECEELQKQIVKE